MSERQDHFVWQEFECRCGGFILIRLNLGLNHRIQLHCPKKGCGAIHERAIRNGQIVDDRVGTAVEKLTPLPSAWSDIPRTQEMRAVKAASKDKFHRDRNGVVVKNADPKTLSLPARPELRQSWLDRCGKRLLGR